MRLETALVLIALAGFVAVVLFGRGMRQGRYVRFVCAMVAIDVAATVGSWFMGRPTMGAYAQVLIAWSALAWLVLDGRAARARWWAATRDPLVLTAPFAGRWRAVAGGPWPRDNHHLVASDQVFAYDFIRTEGASFDEPILAPVDGVVAGASDGMDDQEPRRRVYEELERPFGNYVAIDSGRGVVMLCHLRRGSVRVQPRERVRAGDEIGRCGNSGRTTRPHLHLHAQDRPEPAPFVAQGVAIAFREGERVRVLAAGDCLGDEPPA
jgi:murein DD-endopeptidase MepM/ murein hydrolase activator NlpD